MTDSYDIVIVGGGLVGLSLALAVGQGTHAALKVAVVEPFPLQAQNHPANPSFDARSTALSYSTEHIYRQMGIWQALASSLASIKYIHVSEKGRWGVTRLDAKSQGLECYGHVVPNEILGRILYGEFQHQGRTELLAPMSVTAITPEADGYRLNLSSKTEGRANKVLKSRLVVVADGGRSGLARQLGFHYQEVNYDQHALITNVALSRPHGGIAYERFTGEGAMALLPLTSHEGHARAALVWTIPSRQSQGLVEATEDDFLARLQDVFGYRAGRFDKVGERITYPLKLQAATEQFRPGLVLLGNAAHTLHPVAGQGYNLALRDAMALAECLNGAATLDQLGSGELLSRYVELQKSDQYRTIMGSDGLLKIFGSKTEMIRQVRQVGLVSLNLMTPVKDQFAQVAMGVGGVARNWR